jgi:transcription elongation factor Elf1
MERHCQNPWCENEAVKEVPVSVNKASDEMRSVCAACEAVYSWGVQHGLQNAASGLHILPPPAEEGPRELFRAVYLIDVCAESSHEAARQTYEIMLDPTSMRPVLHVLDSEGCGTSVDLADESSAALIVSWSDQEARTFVLAAATKCPSCLQENLDFASVEIEGQSAHQEASCHDCETKFYVVYRLVGFGLYLDGSTEVHTIAEDFGEIKG